MKKNYRKGIMKIDNGELSGQTLSPVMYDEINRTDIAQESAKAVESEPAVKKENKTDK